MKIPSVIVVFASVGKFLEATLAPGRYRAVGHRQSGRRGGQDLATGNLLYCRATFACSDNRDGGVLRRAHGSGSVHPMGEQNP